MNNRISYLLMMLVALPMVVTGCDQEALDSGADSTRIFEIVPSYAYVGDTVALYGQNLPSDPIVEVNGVAATVIKAAEEKVTFRVPDTTTGEVTVGGNGSPVSYNGFSIYEDVVVSSFYPERVTYDGTLVIKGSGFNASNPVSNVVTILTEDGETTPLKVLSASSDSITVFVEKFFYSNKICVRVGKNVGISDNSVRFVSDARVDSVSPRRGGSGTLVTLKGMNFVTDVISNNSVTIGGVPLEVVSVKDRTEMTVKIPDKMDKMDVVKVSVPGEEVSAFSNDKFRFDAAADINWGKKGITYGAKNLKIPVTQGMVDSLITMGASFISFRCDFVSNGLVDGVIPNAVKVTLENAVRVKQMSSGAIKVILILGQSSLSNYEGVTDASVSSFFTAIKNYTYEGSSVWDCVDAFQVMYSTGEVADVKTEEGVKDYVDGILKPVYKYLHPDGFCKSGEKFVFGPQSILNSNNQTLRHDVQVKVGLLDNMDVFLIMWNLGNGSGNTYYGRSVPETVFLNNWQNLGQPAVSEDPDYPISFMTPEVNINAKNSPYQKVDELGAALQFIAREMNKLPNFKGFGYRAFLENDNGIRSESNNLDPRSSANTATPQISFFDMYKNISIE